MHNSRGIYKYSIKIQPRCGKARPSREAHADAGVAKRLRALDSNFRVCSELIYPSPRHYATRFISARNWIASRCYRSSIVVLRYLGPPEGPNVANVRDPSQQPVNPACSPGGAKARRAQTSVSLRGIHYAGARDVTSPLS